MARRTKLKPHLNSEALRERYLGATDRAERNHFQALWLISQGESQARAGEIAGFSERWVHTLVKRYNAEGPTAMRDRRHEHEGAARAMDKEGEQALKEALTQRPADKGIWTSWKVAVWMSERLGRPVSTSSGWRTLRRLGQTPKRPRPRHKRSDPEAQEVFKEAASSARRRSTGPVSEREGGDLGDG